MGFWERSPIGPFADVMWATPEGERRLLVPSGVAGAFVSAVYTFDRVDVVPFSADLAGHDLDVDAGDVRLHVTAGRGWRIPFRRLRTPAVTRWVEGPVADALLHVQTYGTSPTGVREWYRADEYRPVVAARATVGDRDLGPLRPRWKAAAFGFSEPPRRAAMVRVRPLLQDPSGRLDRVLA